MYVTLSVFIVGAIFVIIDLIPLYQKEEWVSFFLYGSFLAIALIAAVLLDLKVELPSPADPIRNIVTFIFGPKK